MSRQITIVTPENVELRYELAGIGSRFVAHLLDGLLLLVSVLSLALGGFAVYSLLVWMGQAGPIRLSPTEMALWMQAAAGLGLFALFWGYFVGFEIAWNGQTPGKRALGLRVVRERGYPVDPFAAIARNLVRLVDFLPLAYFLGLVSLFLAPRYQRLGDLVAGTLVVKERAAYVPRSVSAAYYTLAQDDRWHRLLGDISSVTPAEYLALKRFVERRWELEFAVQEHLAYELAVPVLTRLRVFVPEGMPICYGDLATAVVEKFSDEKGVL